MVQTVPSCVKVIKLTGLKSVFKERLYVRDVIAFNGSSRSFWLHIRCLGNDIYISHGAMI